MRVTDAIRSLGPALQIAAFRSGIMETVGHLIGNCGAVMLMYHSVAPRADAIFIDPANHVSSRAFIRQMRWLASERRVISMATLVGYLLERRPVPAGSVILTFDDGYLDTLTTAAPVLESYGLPATVFLPTGYIDRGENQWIDQAYGIFLHRSRSVLKWPNDSHQVFRMDDPGERFQAYTRVCADLLKRSGETRRRLLEDLSCQLHPTVPAPRLTMTWSDVNTLVSRYTCFALGAHSVEHVDLSGLSEAAVRSEVRESHDQVLAETGLSPRYFSYPYGRSSPVVRRIVRDQGFLAACQASSIDVAIGAGSDPHWLPRIDAPRSHLRFDLVLSASNTGVLRKLGATRARQTFSVHRVAS